MKPKKLYAAHRKWSTQLPKSQKGIILGADLNQEWLLPWWWENYIRFNSYPVAFVDFGMSEEMKKWCCERGALIPLPVADIFVTEKADMDPTLVTEMETACGNTFWSSRNAWFKKPLGCLKSPFNLTLWIDLDCQICGSLSGIFSHCKNGIAMAKEPPTLCSNGTSYNAGVIAFKYGSRAMQKWADNSFDANHLFRGDQDILNYIIRQQRLRIEELPEIYNWSRMNGPNPDAIVLHWHGPQGKSYISHQIIRANLKTFGI